MSSTPGPWRLLLDDEAQNDDAGTFYKVVDVQDVTVADVPQQPEDTWNAADTARLIAAAPQMRDELGYIIRGWRTVRDNQRSLTPWEEERLAMAEETFRLATGKE